MGSLPKWERERALRALASWCVWEFEGIEPDEYLLQKLGFGSAEAMRIQLTNWGAPDWVTQEQMAEKPKAEKPASPKRKARTSGPSEEVADTSAAADLFNEALDGLARVVEDLEHLDLVYQGKRFVGAYRFRGRWVFPRKSYSEQGWKELCEEYGQDPNVDSFYIDDLTSEHPLGASPYPPRDVVALIAAYALSDRPLEPLLGILFPGHSQEDNEEVKTLFYQTKREGDRKDGLRRTAQQLAAAVYGHKVDKGAPVEIPSRDHLLAGHITALREAGTTDEKIRQDIRNKGYELPNKEFDRLANLGYRFRGT